MRILVTNDDGILAPGLWALVSHLVTVGEVVVVAPDREQSATGPAVTLRAPIRARRAHPAVAGIESFAVEGLPGDAVILGLSKLIQKPVDLVVSGINQGPNLGDDVLISGTVGAALQGYLRNLPAIAVSMASWVDTPNIEMAAKTATAFAARVADHTLNPDIFLSINVPDVDVNHLQGISITQLAHKTHIESVEEGHDGHHGFFWLVRRQSEQENSHDTDIWAIAHNWISVAELHSSLFRRPCSSGLDAVCKSVFKQLKMPVAGGSN
jgi:5'-nucleotidase